MATGLLFKSRIEKINIAKSMIWSVNMGFIESIIYSESMNVIRSIIMLLILVAAAIWLCRLGCQCFGGQSKEHKVCNILRFVLAFIVVVALYVNRWEYIYPFERTVNLELYAVMDIPEEHTLSYPDWHAIYEKWGIHSGSNWMDTESVLQPS